MTPAMASTLATVRIVCTRPPSITPAQLIAANTAMTPIASSCRMPNCQVNEVPNRLKVCANHSGPNTWMSDMKIATAAP